MNKESINLSAMTAEELADRYSCKLQLEFKDGKTVPTGAFYVDDHRLMRQEGAYDEIARNKDEIKALLLKRHDDEIRARRGQTLCNLQPDAALRAGHKGGLALQTEPIHCKISHIIDSFLLIPS